MVNAIFFFLPTPSIIQDPMDKNFVLARRSLVRPLFLVGRPLQNHEEDPLSPLIGHMCLYDDLRPRYLHRSIVGHGPYCGLDVKTIVNAPLRPTGSIATDQTFSDGQVDCAWPSEVVADGLRSAEHPPRPAKRFQSRESQT
jgi:hypothetical protein